MLEIKDLSPEERKFKLDPFVAETEKQGLALLTKEQQARLAQLRVARGGLATLDDPGGGGSGRAEPLATEQHLEVARRSEDQAR